MEKQAALIEKQIRTLTALYTEYQRMLIEEQELIVGAKTQELKVLVDRKEDQAEAIQKAEEARLAAFDALAMEAGLDRQGLKIADIAERLTNREMAGRLVSAKTALQTVLARVRALNEVNNQLLEDSIGYIRKAFEAVTGKKQVKQGYGRTGSMESAVKVSRNLINTKA